MPRRKKRYGQHHLQHPALCRPLVEFLRPAGRAVLEIGPGGGVLTEALLADGARVLAVEVDLEWAFALRRRLADRRQLAVAAADALRVDPRGLAPGSLVAGNLPFQVATPLVRRVVSWTDRVPRAGFLVQEEVARRLTAEPGSADYGALSVLTQARAEVRWLGRVPRRQFRPPPRVDGAFVGLTLRPPPLPEGEMGGLNRFVHLAFARRRKTLRNSLGAAWERPAVDRLLATAGLRGTVRAESLTVAELVDLYRQARRLGLRPPAAAHLRPGRGGAPGRFPGAGAKSP